MFSSEPVSRLSMQITRWPWSSRCSQRWEPRKPAPPVTTQVRHRPAEDSAARHDRRRARGARKRAVRALPGVAATTSRRRRPAQPRRPRAARLARGRVPAHRPPLLALRRRRRGRLRRRRSRSCSRRRLTATADASRRGCTSSRGARRWRCGGRASACSPASRVAEPLSEAPGPAEWAERRERVAHSAAALAALKPQERRALALKAEGYSYAEMQTLTGWTYTKVNRCMAEGRKRFLELFAAIHEGTL